MQQFVRDSHTLKCSTSLFKTLLLVKVHSKFCISVQASPYQQAGKAIWYSLYPVNNEVMKIIMSAIIIMIGQNPSDSFCGENAVVINQFSIEWSLLNRFELHYSYSCISKIKTLH